MERALPTTLQALAYVSLTAIVSLPLMILIYNWVAAGR
jgi:hypothetical protein